MIRSAESLPFKDMSTGSTNTPLDFSSLYVPSWFLIGCNLFVELEYPPINRVCEDAVSSCLIVDGDEKVPNI